MRTIFSTNSDRPGDPFKVWRDTIRERIAPVEQSRIEPTPFQGRIEICDVGTLSITRVTQGALRTEVTRESVRRDSRQDGLSVVLKISGDAWTEHNGFNGSSGPGDIVVLDRSKPALLKSTLGSCSYVIELARDNFERQLGRTALFSGLTIPSSQLSAALTCGFLDRLARGAETVGTSEAERMAAIMENLLIATVAERLCREPSAPTNGTLTLLRAKSYVRDHSGDRALDPHGLASTMGISIRRLQELFQEHGQSVSAWIWECRCEAAAAMLRDPASRHMTVGEVAERTGFATHAHLSRRFRNRFGQTPIEYRIGKDGLSSCQGE